MPSSFNEFFIRTYLINVRSVEGLDILHEHVRSKDHKCKVETIWMFVGSILEQNNGE
jgi:hypothetical protein